MLKEIAAAHELGDQGHLAGWHPETVFNASIQQIIIIIMIELEKRISERLGNNYHDVKKIQLTSHQQTSKMLG